MSVMAVRGARKPRVFSHPPYKKSTGVEAVKLARLAGLDLDPWQQDILKVALGEKPDGSWAATEVGLVLPRQNGKTGLCEARILAGLFLIRERLIVFSSHQYDSSLEVFRRVRNLVEGTPALDQRVKRYIAAHGEEGIELRDGCRVRFRTRTKGGGRGFSAPCVIFDEAMQLSEASMSAILPVVSAQPNPQVWYVGSAVDQLIFEHGIVLARVRNRGLRGDPNLAYFEWSIDKATPGEVEPELASDPAMWAQANPALGIRIDPDYVAGEQASLGPRAFAVERLGVGDWPDPDFVEESVISPEAWLQRADETAVLDDPVCFAFDVAPDRSTSAVAAAGVDLQGRPMVEVAKHGPGTAWVVPWLAGRVQKHRPVAVVCDATGASASLLPDLQAERVKVKTMSAGEHAQAAGHLYDLVHSGLLVHLGQPELGIAVRGATKRPLGGGWAWNRKTSLVDISPLVAATLALGGYRTNKRTTPRAVSLADIEDDDDE